MPHAERSFLARFFALRVSAPEGPAFAAARSAARTSAQWATVLAREVPSAPRALLAARLAAAESARAARTGSLSRARRAAARAALLADSLRTAAAAERGTA